MQQKTMKAMKKTFFNMIPSPDTACILIYGDIGGPVNDADIAAELYGYAAQYKSIDIRINSLGGSVYAGLAIFNAIRNSDADIHIYVDGVAASMASVIALCGKPVQMSRYARLMLHNVYGGCYGNKQDLKDMAMEIEGLEDTLAEMYAARIGKEKQEIKDTYFDGKDHWLTAREALDLGFIDGIYDTEEPVPEESTNEDIYAIFNNRLNTNSKPDTFMYEQLKKRTAFANCANEADMIRIIGSLEDKAGKYDNLVTENQSLKQEIQGYKQKEVEARKQEMKEFLDKAEMEERFSPSQRPAYEAMLEKDYEQGKTLVNALPVKKRIMDIINQPANHKDTWEETWNKIKKNNGFN